MSLQSEQLVSQSVIRIESVLSRFPVHRLAKRGVISIDIKEAANGGEIKTRWEVSYNSKYGQPGPLAYKVDSLIVNRRIEEAPRPLPKLIKLGSLRDICRELDLNEGQALGQVKKALLQNASAFITAQRSFKGIDGTERTAEISDTRYGVIFTGEKFPEGGGRADAVYILLHDSYRDVLNTAPTRPLDYEYLKELAPAPQRFYELLSYQIFAALRNNLPRAKMLYSYYCTRAPQTRYFDYEHVKKQMYKLHAPHRASGYITAVEFRQTTDDEGRADWEMLYTPGRKAKAEFRTFNELKGAPSKGRKTQDQATTSITEDSESPSSSPALSRPLSEDDNLIVRELIDHGIHLDTAMELVITHSEEVKRQLGYLPFRAVKKNKAGLLRDAIRGRWTPPDEYAESKRKEDEQQRSNERLKRKKAEEAEASARRADEERDKSAYLAHLKARLKQIGEERPEDYKAFLKDSAEKRTAVEQDPSHSGQAKRIYLRLFDDEESQMERIRCFFGEQTFEEWRQHRSAETESRESTGHDEPRGEWS